MLYCVTLLLESLHHTFDQLIVAPLSFVKLKLLSAIDSGRMASNIVPFSEITVTDRC